MKLSAALTVSGLCLSGCATIVEGTTQSISINTMPVDGAKCELQNSEGTWFITSPGSAVVHKTKNDLKVTCKKDGYQDAIVTVPSKFGGATAGNILAGGVIGIGIDAASGANYSYTPNTSVQLLPNARIATEPAIIPATIAETMPEVKTAATSQPELKPVVAIEPELKPAAPLGPVPECVLHLQPCP